MNKDATAADYVGEEHTVALDFRCKCVHICFMSYVDTKTPKAVKLYINLGNNTHVQHTSSHSIHEKHFF